MRKPKKPSALSRARAEATVLRQALLGQDAAVADLRHRLTGLEAQLLEARRRTIPFSGGMGELNFLPLAITKLDVRHDTIRVKSWTGEEIVANGMSRATIEVDGMTMVPTFAPKK